MHGCSALTSITELKAQTDTQTLPDVPSIGITACLNSSQIFHLASPTLSRSQPLEPVSFPQAHPGHTILQPVSGRLNAAGFWSDGKQEWEL